LQHRGPDRWPFLKRLFRVPLVELRRFFPFVVSFQVGIFVANLAPWRSSEFPEDWISRFCMTTLHLQRRRGALAWRIRKCCEASFRAKDASTEIDGTLLGCESLGIVGQVCRDRSEEHTSELQSRGHLVCRLLLEKKKSSSVVLRCSSENAPCRCWP